MAKDVLITIVVIALVLIGGFFIVKNYYYTPNNTGANGALGENPNDGTSAGSETTNPATEDQTATAASSPKLYEVKMQVYSFMPTNLTIKVGDSVKWSNEDSTSHTITSDSGDVLRSPIIASRQDFIYTFKKAGTYPYHCTFHSGMKGIVVVE